MILVKIHYGLGNQLFQYALAKSLQLGLGYEVKLDNSFYKTNLEEKHPRIFALDKFNITLSLANEKETPELYSKKIGNRIINKIENICYPYYKRKLVAEQTLEFDNRILNIKDNKYIFGYWQDERYFQKFEKEIRQDFVFKIPPEGINEKLYNEISSKPNSVCVHIRRGDYITDTTILKLLGFCDETYYQNAVRIIAEKINNPEFYIFSDEPEWVKENFHIPFKSTVVSHNSEADAIEDIRLMSACNHQIISNSSFGWWSGWLNNKKDKYVMAPQKWRKNGPDMYIPKEWIRI